MKVVATATTTLLFAKASGTPHEIFLSILYALLSVFPYMHVLDSIIAIC